MKKKKILLVMPIALTLTSLKAMDTQMVAVPAKPKRMYSEVVQPEMPRHLNPEVLLTMNIDDPDLEKALKSVTKTNLPSTVAKVGQYRRLKALSLNPNLTARCDSVDLSHNMGKIELYLNETEGVEKTELLLAGLKTTEHIDLSKTLLLHRQNLQAQDVILDSEKEAHAIQEKQKAQEAATLEQANRRAILLAELTKLEQEKQLSLTEKQKDQKRLKQLESTQRIAYQNQQFATKAEEEHNKQKKAEALQNIIKQTKQNCVKLENEIASLMHQQVMVELLQIAGQSVDDNEWKEREKVLTNIKTQITELSSKKQTYEERVRRMERGENPISLTSSSTFQPLLTAALAQIRKPHEEQDDEPLQFATPIDESAQVAQVSYNLDTVALSGLPLNDADVQSAFVTLEKTKADVEPLNLGKALLYAHALFMNVNIQKNADLKNKVIGYLEHYKAACNNPTILQALEALTRTVDNPLDLTTSKMFSNDPRGISNQLEKLKAQQTQTNSPLSEIQNADVVVVEQLTEMVKAQITSHYLSNVAKLNAQMATQQEVLNDIDKQRNKLQAQQTAQTDADPEVTNAIAKLDAERKNAEDELAKVSAQKTHLQEEYLKALAPQTSQPSTQKDDALDSQTPQSSIQKKEVSWFWRLLGY